MSSVRRPVADPGKFSRYRAAQKARGLKLLRIWTPDPSAPGFEADIERQVKALRGAPEEAEALDLIAAAGDWTTDGA